jgi:hypothetical protein
VDNTLDREAFAMKVVDKCLAAVPFGAVQLALPEGATDI